MKAKIAGLILALCLFSGALRGESDVPKEISRQYREACDNLICQCGCNEQLSVCAMQNCSSATPMRAEIRERLLKGETVQQVVDSFVARMGRQVLSAPTTKGFDLTAWIAPFFMLCLGVVVVGWIVVKLVRPPAQTVLDAPAPAEADDLKCRIDRELRDFEQES
jgi:cytochrome c-type biogenesis protein CcmH/NrfF